MSLPSSQNLFLPQINTKNDLGSFEDAHILNSNMNLMKQLKL